MSKKALERAEEQIQRGLSEIVEFEARDPRFSLVTIMDVRLSIDFRHATVYISVLEESTEAETLAALREHRGFFRSELAKKLNLRYTPELIFQIDEASKRARRIEELLAQEKPPHPNSHG